MISLFVFMTMVVCSLPIFTTGFCVRRVPLLARRPFLQSTATFSTHSSGIPPTTKVVQPGHVYFVATPIGNVKDITTRAKEILASVDVITAEDTRETKSLLSQIDIRLEGTQKIVISHHEHNIRSSMDKIISYVKEGKSVAVVSDAGTPGISDPGTDLANVCHRENIPVHPIPGPSAVATALSVSGFSCSPFLFLGFLPVKGKERKEMLDRIKYCGDTIVVYEAPHRILKLLEDIKKLDMGSRSIVAAREMTKTYEEYKRETVQEALIRLAALEKDLGKMKGEFTVVLGPCKADERKDSVIIINKKCFSEEERKNITEEWNEYLVKLEEDEDASIMDVNLPEDVKIKKILRQCCYDGFKRSDAVRIVEQLLSPKTKKSEIYRTALAMEWDSPPTMTDYNIVDEEDP